MQFILHVDVLLIVGMGKRSRTHVGSGSRRERQHSSQALVGHTLSSSVRYPEGWAPLPSTTNRIPVRVGRARSVRIVKTLKPPVIVILRSPVRARPDRVVKDVKKTLS